MFSYEAKWYCIHPQNHVTELQNQHIPSNCGTCECPIAGKTLTCGACNSNLHPFCQTSTESLLTDLHPHHHLTRLNRDPIVLLTRHCAVCSEEIKGVSYTCSPCDFDVHPQCSQLPCRVPHGPESHQVLVLQIGLETPLPIANCHVCGELCGKWAYRCDACLVNIHFWCLLTPATTAPLQCRQLSTPTPHHFDPPPPYYNAGSYLHQHHTTARGVERHWGPRNGQGQADNGVPMPPAHHLPYYYYYPYNYNAGGFQHQHNGYQHNHGTGDSSNGGIMARIGKSLAVNLICDFVIKMLLG